MSFPVTVPGRTPVVMQADCRDAMPGLSEPFDIILTSPPYDAGKSYEGKPDIVAYEAFARTWMTQAACLLKPAGSLWLNVGYTKLGPNETLPLSYLYHTVRPRELRLVQEVVWHYEGGMSYKRRFSHRTERWQWYALNPDIVHFNLDAVRDMRLNRTRDRRNNPLGKNPTDLWYFDRVTGGRGKSAQKTAHPCQFPEAMVERILRACCPVGGTVLDPFAGSGTTGRVAAREGMHATLIEREASYVSIINGAA